MCLCRKNNSKCTPAAKSKYEHCEREHQSLSVNIFFHVFFKISENICMFHPIHADG